MKPSLRLAAPLALVVALSSLLAPAFAEDPPAPAAAQSSTQDAGRTQLLKKAASGRQAIRQLGGNLDEAARRSGMTEERLRQVLITDDSAVVYPSGRLAYADTFVSHAAGEAPPPAVLVTAASTEPPVLHSRPGATRTIFLDFDGAYVGNTSWNEGDDAIPSQFYDGFDLDDDLSEYSAAEMTYMQEVWRIIAETYSEMDVDVTTEDLGDDAYNRSDVGDLTYGDHVLFTEDPASFPICPPANQCGGVAFVSTFDDPYDGDGYFEPAWVRNFDNAFDAAMAASHEIGHTLGLDHDGRTSPSEEYYEGQGAWTPMMGAGPNAIHQFSNGDYANANNKQDDFAVMADNGLPRLPDDAGNTATTANTLGARTAFAEKGTISSRTDVDYYKVGPCTAVPSITATGSGSGSALDLRLDVLSTTGAALGSSNPASSQTTGNPYVASGMNASLTPSPTPANQTYVVKVDGVGNGSPSTTGYSDYGSVGTYTLAVNGCVAANGLEPDPPTSFDLTTNKSNGTVSWLAPMNGAAPTGYRVVGLPSGPLEVPAGPASISKAVKVNGGNYVNLSVVAFNSAGASTPVELTHYASSFAPTAAPAVSVSTKVLTATVKWSPAANPGGAGLSYWRITVLGQNFDYHPADRQAKFSFSTYGTFSARLTPVYAADDGSTAPSRAFTMILATTPSAPKIKSASSGKSGGSVSATARWSAGFNGGAAITSYKVVAYKLNSRGKVVGTKTSKALKGSARSYAFKLSRGTYKFKVVAYTVKGASPKSKSSNKVKAR